MSSNLSLQENMGRLNIAGFPILYINSFEEDIVDKIITKAVNRKKYY